MDRPVGEQSNRNQSSEGENNRNQTNQSNGGNNNNVKNESREKSVKKNTANATADATDRSNGNKKKKFKNNRRNNNSTFKPKYKKPSVKCNVPELKDWIFDCAGARQPEEYKQAKEALEGLRIDQVRLWN